MTRRSTAAINTLTALLRTVELGLDARRSLNRKQILGVAAWRARDENIAARVSRAEAVRLARRIRDLREQRVANERALRELVTEVAPALLTLRGVGLVNAGVIYSSWSHAGRIRSDAAFASLAGTSPIPASTGNTTRHRLNRGGDRRLNRALHNVAINRVRCDTATRQYVAKRTAEGRSKKEIIRGLKRYITRQLYKPLSQPDSA